MKAEESAPVESSSAEEVKEFAPAVEEPTPGAAEETLAPVVSFLNVLDRFKANHMWV